MDVLRHCLHGLLQQTRGVWAYQRESVLPKLQEMEGGTLPDLSHKACKILAPKPHESTSRKKTKTEFFTNMEEEILQTM